MCSRAVQVLTNHAGPSVATSPRSAPGILARKSRACSRPFTASISVATFEIPFLIWSRSLLRMTPVTASGIQSRLLVEVAAC